MATVAVARQPQSTTAKQQPRKPKRDRRGASHRVARLQDHADFRASVPTSGQREHRFLRQHFRAGSRFREYVHRIEALARLNDGFFFERPATTAKRLSAGRRNKQITTPSLKPKCSRYTVHRYEAWLRNAGIIGPRVTEPNRFGDWVSGFHVKPHGALAAIDGDTCTLCTRGARGDISRTTGDISVVSGDVRHLRATAAPHARHVRATKNEPVAPQPSAVNACDGSDIEQAASESPGPEDFESFKHYENSKPAEANAQTASAPFWCFIHPNHDGKENERIAPILSDPPDRSHWIDDDSEPEIEEDKDWRTRSPAETLKVAARVLAFHNIYRAEDLCKFVFLNCLERTFDVPRRVSYYLRAIDGAGPAQNLYNTVGGVERDLALNEARRRFDKYLAQCGEEMT